MSESKTRISSAVYRTIEKELREQIRKGRWPLGAMFPSRRDLAREYNVSSVTVGRAIQSLISEGTLHADSRKGTFVARTPMNQAMGQASDNAERQTDFSRDFQLAGDRDRKVQERRIVRAGTVGIIAANYIEKLSHDAIILSAIEQAVSEAGCVTYTFNRASHLYGQLAPLDVAIDVLRRERVDAMTIISLDLDRAEVEEALSRVDIDATPTVCILAGELHLPIPHVFYDNRIGGYQAAKHLIDTGHREITVFAPSTASWITERIAGINHAAAQAKLQKVDVQVIADTELTWTYLEDSTTAAYNLTRSALASGWKPEGGIIGINDLVAFGVMRALSEEGVQAGRDYAMVGFDDDAKARTVGLTTLRPPLEAMGREAARLLLEEMSGTRVNQQLRLRAHLIPRYSSNMLRELVSTDY